MLSSTLTTVEIPLAGDKSKGKAHNRYGFGGNVGGQVSYGQSTLREAPEAAEPHENAMKAIALIADRKHPIAMYLDRDFTQRMNLGGP